MLVWVQKMWFANYPRIITVPRATRPVGLSPICSKAAERSGGGGALLIN